MIIYFDFLSEVFCAIDDVPFAPEVINSVRDALGVDIFLCTSML